jgi:hypothetical protein
MTKMSQAKGEQTPTEMLAKIETASAIDKRGRRIVVKRLNALQLYRLAKIPGGASTATATDLATLACSVTKIDTLPIAFPATEQDVEFLIQQLDFDGLAAAAEALKQLSDGADEEAAKNSAGDPPSN